MTHLYIELNTSGTEEVNSSIISKLYELAISGDLDNTSDLKGRLHTSACKDIYYEYLTGSVNGTKRFPELYITADNLYISFVDSVAELICVSNWGTSDGVTNTQLQAVVNNDLTANGPFVLTNIVNFPEFSKFTGVTKLNNNVFSQCTQLQSITLPSSCTELGRAVFYGDTALSQINLSNIESIDGQCFLNCSSLSGTINLPNLTTIKGGSVFNGCSSIQEINLGSNLQSISGENMFAGCTKLTTVTGMSEVTTIPQYMFVNCTSLSSIDIDWTKITSLLIDCFNGCSSLPLTNLSIPNLTSLGASVFGGCKQLTSIDLSLSSIAVVSRQAFEGCNNLSKLKFPSTAINLNYQWCNNIASTLYITGLDNINTHSEYNWLITNKNILNPIKDSLSTGGAIIRNTGNNTVTSIHSLYEPIRVSTPKGYFELSYNLNGWLVYASGGNAMMNIGLLYLRDITSFGYVTFYRCNITNLVINNITPPTHSTNTSLSSDPYYTSWGNSIFGDLTSSGVGEKAFIGTLWVPDSAVASYLADPQYSGLTIKGINTKTNGVDYDLPRYADFSAWEAAEEAAVAQGGHAPQGLIESWM